MLELSHFTCRYRLWEVAHGGNGVLKSSRGAYWQGVWPSVKWVPTNTWKASFTLVRTPTIPATGASPTCLWPPLDADGMVRSSAEFSILRPANPQMSNQRIFLDVLNRGRRRALKYFNSAPDPLDPSAPLEPGNGFLMREGYTVVWCGWQHDVPPDSGLLSLKVPDALDPDSRPNIGKD